MVLREPHAALRINKAREVRRRRHRKLATPGRQPLTPFVFGRSLHIEILDAPIEPLTNSLLPFGEGEKAAESIPPTSTPMKVAKELEQHRRLL